MDEIKHLGIYLEESFITKYVTTVKSDYIIVFLFLKSITNPTIQIAAKTLKMETIDIYKAVAFWEAEGLLEEKDNTITFNSSPKKQVKPLGKKPEYDPMELSIYADKNPQVKELFDMAQSYLGRFLTHADLSSIFSIYSWIGLTIPVIEKLLIYCTQTGHRNMRYIEQVAIDWSENNITTPEQADEKIRIYNVDFRKIMRAMGQANREPIQKEQEYMKNWIQELNFPIDLIVLACEKTVLNIGKASFAYANKTLLNWQSEGIKTVEEATNQQENFSNKSAQSKEMQKTEVKKENKQSKNKFVNFEQRDYNFSDYERLEFERISKKGLE